MDKRYQVFVSSTYDDLHSERQEVMHALLELDCIPSGMELFPAANEDQWTLIKKVIDDCDYYLVIVGGRYGSVRADGISYTEAEYRYATERGKPTIAFLHRDPESLPVKKTEKSSELRAKLAEFRTLCQTKHCKYWETAADLGSVVSRSLIQLIKAHPGVGWVRADLVPDESAAAEILKLRRQLEEAQQLLQQARHSPPPGTEGLASGDDTFSIAYDLAVKDEDYEITHYQGSIEATWNEIFSKVAPLMIHEADDDRLRSAVKELAQASAVPQVAKRREVKGKRLSSFKIKEDDFQAIRVQLRAIGLITRSNRQRSVKDTATYWTLTPYGDSVMTKLCAIRRP
jgi:hypothetical protein